MQKTLSLNTVIPESLHGLRLDAALSQLFPEYSRNQIQHWIKQSNVTINGKTAEKPRQLASTGENITIEAEIRDNTTSEAQSIPLSIVYEDEHLLVINKPVGLVVHPGAGNQDGTLVNALLYYSPEQNKIPRAGIVHRLDKDTSGLLVVARTLPAHNALIRLMQQRQITREYRALVQGQLISGGTIDAPIARHGIQRTKMAVTDSGREAITHYRVLSRFPAHTLLSVHLETGRTHQIRVHLAHINYPIVGDNTYGKQRIYPQLSVAAKEAIHAFRHQALHAYRLALTHPFTNEEMEWIAPLPEDFQQLINILDEKSQK